MGHMKNGKSGDLGLDLALLSADPSLDFSFLMHKTQGLKSSTLNAPVFSLYQPQAMAVLKDEHIGEQNQSSTVLFIGRVGRGH